MRISDWSSDVCSSDLLSSWPGDYDNYLRRREERLHAESQEVALFDKKMAQEEVWIRKGVQARRTRDMGRVKRLLEMREQYAQRRKQQGTAQFTLQAAKRSGKENGRTACRERECKNV